MKRKSIYEDSSINTTILLFLLSACMIGFSIYLTGHYFDLRFPTGLESGSLCNLNSFFNCDKTTLSPLSNIAGIPISIFGIIIGGLVMLGLVLKNEKFEKTIHFTLIVNMIGCVILFLYSLIGLGGLCPFCTLYYIASGLTLWMFYKKSGFSMPDMGYLGGFLVVVLIAGFLTKSNIDKKIANLNSVANDLIKQYYALPNLGQPNPASEFKIVSSANAPIKMQIFSDFECPACKALSELMPQIISRYGGKIDIEYFYYPLDHNCNPSMQRPMHQQACRAAYYSTCMPRENFGLIHDEIFANQEKIASYLDGAIKSNQVEKCVADPSTKAKVVALINAASPFNIRSTPSFLLNGVKIEGVLPSEQLFAIMDEILKRAK